MVLSDPKKAKQKCVCRGVLLLPGLPMLQPSGSPISTVDVSVNVSVYRLFLLYSM